VEVPGVPELGHHPAELLEDPGHAPDVILVRVARHHQRDRPGSQPARIRAGRQQARSAQRMEEGRHLRPAGRVHDDRTSCPDRVLRKDDHLGVAVPHVAQEVQQLVGVHRIEERGGLQPGRRHRCRRAHVAPSRSDSDPPVFHRTVTAP
jgi:hypothetical protein